MQICFLWLILAAVSVSPTKSDKSDTSDKRPDVAGMEFDRIQVDWVATSTKVRSLEDVLPRRQAWLLRQLGCGRYECRVMAEEELGGMGESAFQALCWGTRVADPMISHTSSRLLEPMYKCRGCLGTGRKDPYKQPHTTDYDLYYNRCPQCTGTGDLRYVRRWEHGEEVFVRNELFPQVKVVR